MPVGSNLDYYNLETQSTPGLPTILAVSSNIQPHPIACLNDDSFAETNSQEASTKHAALIYAYNDLNSAVANGVEVHGAFKQQLVSLHLELKVPLGH